MRKERKFGPDTTTNKAGRARRKSGMDPVRNEIYKVTTVTQRQGWIRSNGDSLIAMSGIGK